LLLQNFRVSTGVIFMSGMSGLNILIWSVALVALFSSEVQANELDDITAKPERIYFQIFPNYFPMPKQTDNPDADDNSKTRIFSPLKLHPNEPVASSFVVRNEVTEDGKTQKTFTEKKGNEFLYSMSCRPEIVRILEKRQTLQNEIRLAQKTAWDYRKSVERVATLSNNERAELAAKAMDMRMVELKRVKDIAAKGQNGT
jgi:hypothetical protein